MTIRFKCSCGRELDVPDESAGKEAFCPGCRKGVPVPAAEGIAERAPQDEREVSEFKPGALANLLGNEASGPAASPAPPPAAPAPAQAPEPVSPPAPAGPAPANSPQAGPPAPAERAAADAPAAAAPAGAAAFPPGVEVLPDRLKFRCRCGQKVGVRLPPPGNAGKCPRCKRDLEVPVIPGVTDRRPAAREDRRKTGAVDLRHCGKCGRRIEDASAAYCPRCGFPMSQEAAPAAAAAVVAQAPAQPAGEVRRRSAREAAALAAELLRPPDRSGSAPLHFVPGRPAEAGRRLGAALLDLAAAGAVAVAGQALAGAAGAGGSLLPAAAAGCAFALANEVVFAALAGGRSLGMLISGVRVVSHEGLPPGFLLLLVRFLSFSLLFFGSPLALIDSQRRALHDLVCGTTVRRLTV